LGFIDMIRDMYPKCAFTLYLSTLIFSAQILYLNHEAGQIGYQASNLAHC